MSAAVIAVHAPDVTVIVYFPDCIALIDAAEAPVDHA
jgi:hypothetical protein